MANAEKTQAKGMEFTIRSEECRRALAQVLWCAASRRVEEKFHDELFEHAWTFVHPAYGWPEAGRDPTAKMTESFAVLDAIRAADKRLAAAAIGEVVELPLAREAVIWGLRDSADSILESNGPFSRLPVEEQRDILGCRAAALALLDELGAAEAVA